ncbi:pentatricopeptide repeat-containing protein At5g04780 isoform X3 [Arachis ipaensis]|uniref:pentatricopeptide repeat-containing protein At5g04780 isoform X3 n=1 Tax=Arachis ipaensis TaxID=130454 RepID=UPI000A2B8CD8|nr:pentatricopeptide repeat-containing protein At5g04780 isoform X3 [Arachis ipaensis]XP_029151201.1 pentatricopeptide repeat-containing protein At5g04780, mitochondrial-like isoform X3 [Arachis hypogaea]
MKTVRRCQRFCGNAAIHFRKLTVLAESEPDFLESKQVLHADADKDATRVSNLHYLVQLYAKIRSSMAGRACHAYAIRIGLEFDVLTSNMIINMYSKCGLVDDARQVFDEMPVRSLVSWNTIIGALTQNAENQEPLLLFIQMQRDGTPFNEFTISSVVCACALNCATLECMQLHAFSIKAAVDSNCFVGTALVDVYAKCSSIEDASRVFESMATLIEGKQVHAISWKSGFGSNVYVASSLVDMYAKCGCIREASLVFQGVELRSKVLWNAMISGFAKHACALEARIIFEKMQQRGLLPDEVSYVSVLNACSHIGLYKEGEKYFELMVREHNLSPNALHYSCMIDILGRAGLVHNAYDLIQRMPFEATASMWGSLLASCRNYGNIEFAEIAAKHLFEMEPSNAGNHVLLANIYATNKKWEEVARARKLLRESDLRKERGSSWIEIKNKVHSFTVGERNHPQMNMIYDYLDNLVEELKKLNYKVDTNHDLHDVDENRKQMLLKHHSEKLAVSYGLMSLPSDIDIPIRIMKNLRICGDCHNFMKLVSKFTSREIIVRDTNRFHHFKDGCCSCGEFW